jgi:hypothetical protein
MCHTIVEKGSSIIKRAGLPDTLMDITYLCPSGNSKKH